MADQPKTAPPIAQPAPMQPVQAKPDAAVAIPPTVTAPGAAAPKKL